MLHTDFRRYIKISGLHEVAPPKGHKLSMASSYLQTYSLSEFFEYMMPAKLTCITREPKVGPYGWVFWNQENEECQRLEALRGTPIFQFPISERIKHALQRVRQERWRWTLVQFWAPKTIGGRFFLSSFDQPFALLDLSRDCCSYRKECMSQDIYICKEGDDKPEEKQQLNPTGRAFCNGEPESSPDVRFYSLQEFPQRDQARLCGLSELVALPVFEINGQTCVGVLEFLGFSVDRYSLNDLALFERMLNVVGLTSKLGYTRSDSEGQQYAWKEIEEVFKVVVGTHPLALALAFTPLTSCGDDEYWRDYFNLGDMELAVCEKTFYRDSLEDFIKANKTFHLQKGKGVGGKALTTLKSCFCRNICDFTINEYPLVHFARHAGLSLSFAICLQATATQFENHHLVLEFFLLPGNYSYEYTHSLLESLVIKIKQHLQSFKIASEDVPGEEIFTEVINSFDNDYWRVVYDDRDKEQVDSVDQYPMLEDDATNSVGRHVHVVNAKENDVSITHAEKSVKTKTSKRQAKREKLHIDHDSLKQHFGKPLDDVAESLGVSRSTIKRICRNYGIFRWPSHKKNKRNCSLFEMGNTNAPPHGAGGEASILVSGRYPPCSNLSHQDNAHGHGTITQDARLVAVKVSYGELPMIKFQVSCMSELAQLKEQVAKRLTLNVESFSMMYQDEDNDWILITYDADLRYCMETLTSSSKTTIRMSVRFNSN